LVLPALTDSVTKARHAVSAYAREVGGPVVEVESFVSEAVANSVLHGYPGQADGLVTVDAQITFDGRLLVRVMDDGVGISPNKGRRGLGFGIALMASHTASLAIERLPGGGTGVFGHFDLPPSARPRGPVRRYTEEEPRQLRR
jgi:stage II sporulation protein AB (anti-sigma F factor)